MRHWTLIAVSASIILGGCGGTGGTGGNAASNAAVHRKPGSWSSKIEIARLEGKDAKPGTREEMQQMFNAMSGMSVCLTPEAVAQEDISKNLEQSAGSSACKFEKRDVSGGKIDLLALCDREGQKVRMSAHGTNGDTAQDFTLKVEPLDAAGKSEGVMDVTTKYNGECKPGDFKPPVAPKAPAKP